MWKVNINAARCAVILFLSVLFYTARSQEMLGLISSNYAGINGVLINPSSLHNSKVYLDINVIGANVFHQNNYLYIAAEEYKFTNFFRQGYAYPTHPSGNGSGERPLYTIENTDDKNSYTQLKVLGPSFMLLINDHAIAFSTGFRMINMVRNLPYDMANYFYYGLGYLPQRDIRYTNEQEYNTTTMSWSEFAMTYSVILRKFYKHKWSGGVTVRGLLGHGGSYINGYHTDYTVPDGETIDIHRLDMDVGYALPVDYHTNEFMPGGLIKGKGISFDLGVTYQRNKKGHSNMKYRKLCNQKFDDYDYRVGLSLLDLGALSFTDNARLYQYDNGVALWENVDSLVQTYENLNAFSEALSEKFCGTPDCAMTAEKFKVALPAAVSLQFDYHLKNSFYLNSTWVQPLRLGKAHIYRPAILAVTPRFETNIFGFMLPVSLYNYTKPRIGAALRIYNFTIGTEKVLGFFNMQDFTGLDLYFSVKITILKGNCRKPGKSERFCNDNPFRMNKRS